MTRSILALAMFALLCALLPATALAEPDENGVYPMIFPVQGPHYYSDTFGAPRGSGRTHAGQDIMTYGEKGVPVVAVADGTVRWIGSTCCYLAIEHPDGWETWYIHLNNDSPGTDDGSIGPLQAVAPGIEEGAFVAAGQPLGWVGDSGNAEGTTPHTHFEVHHNERIINPYPYLKRVWDLLNFRWDMGNRVL